LVEGHTNDIGDDAFNYGLSERRAAAVVDWLVRSGIDRNRLASKGYGETRPVVPNDSDEHRAQNRRVDFTIVSRQ
jgi:outer membrane protein OmpA-like peptidoglycan-associated protein